MKEILYLLKKERTARIGLVIVVAVILLGVFAPVIAPYDPVTANAAHSRMAPCAEHILALMPAVWIFFLAAFMPSASTL